MVKISVDEEKCIGCGTCASICSESFELKNGKAHVKKPEIDKLTCQKDAESSCPVGAISIKK